MGGVVAKQPGSGMTPVGRMEDDPGGILNTVWKRNTWGRTRKVRQGRGETGKQNTHTQKKEKKKTPCVYSDG